MTEEEILRKQLEYKEKANKIEAAKLESNYIFIFIWIALGALLTIGANLHPALGFGIGAVVGYFAGRYISQRKHGVKLDH
jgi:hypothetical protein